MSVTLKNYINGNWIETSGNEFLNVVNPADGQILARVPAGSADDVRLAGEAARDAQFSWREVPANHRIQYLYKMKQILERNSEEIAGICTRECGKTIAESRGEITRAIENIEVACGIPMLLQSEFSEDITKGIDEFYIRQPVGTGACITPFNFPVMISFWFMPYALACGNTYIIKPSEKVPLSMTRIFELFDELKLPPGVLNLVHGGKPAADGILENPHIAAISFVGSTPVAKYIYKTGAAYGKRIQAQGGAKNAVVIMPDAEPETTVRIIADSAFGCAGQRCLAASLVIMVGEAAEIFTGKIIEAAKDRKTGNGIMNGVEMGPVISPESKRRIENLIRKGTEEGAELLLDGRNISIPGCENGNFIGPTVLGNVHSESELFKTEIFGPVLSLVNVDTIEDAIEMINKSRYGNSACIFTRNGAAARKFRHDTLAGNIGINIGIAAPSASFPFSGWKESFFGDLHGQSAHAVEFYTQTKVVIERWHEDWSRKF